MMLHHEILGPEGAPWLLMGGSLGTTLQMWERQRPLSDSLRLVRFDHRGHGASAVPDGPYEIEAMGRDVLDLMDRLGLPRASFCGLSLGGMVGMWLAAYAPERIERLILLCTSPYMPPAAMWRERARTVTEAGSVEPIADAVLERWLTTDCALGRPAMREWLRAMLVATPPAGYAACCGAIERMDLRDALREISAPTLVISGADDPSTPPEQHELITQAIRGARHEVVRPAAHLAAVEQPERVNQLIVEHLT